MERISANFETRAERDQLRSTLLVSIERNKDRVGIIINGMPGALMALRDMIDEALRCRSSTLRIDARDDCDRYMSLYCVTNSDGIWLDEQAWTNRGSRNDESRQKREGL